MKLREIRYLRNMSQEDLANILGMEKSNISKYESGRSIPAERLKKLAEALNVTPDVIMSDDDLIVTGDGVISTVPKNYSNSNENIDPDVLFNLTQILKSHDVKWQKELLEIAKIKTEFDIDKLQKIIDICS